MSRWRRQRRDAGAVAIIVTTLVAGGVLIGSLAISVDIGSIMSERRQLQNGADASAMALAQLCAAQSTSCADPMAKAAIKPLANANAKDGLSSISNVCAANVSTIVTSCETPDAGSLTKCNPTPSWMDPTLPYVEVKTQTQTSSGSTLMTPFGQALAGGGAGTTVTSCARAAWGIPGSYTATVPIVISECEWKANTSNGLVYQAGPGSPWPGYGTTPGQTSWPLATGERTIYLKTTTTVNCAINGKDTAGGFGYVIDGSGNCTASVSTSNWAQIDTGSSPPNGCNSIIPNLLGTVINLPIFDCLVRSGSQPTGGISDYPDCTGASGGGAQSWYHIQGWAKFYLSGYKIGGSQQAASLLSGSVPCSGGDRCLSGWFVSGTLTLTPGSTVTPPTNNNNFGAYQIIPVG